MPNVHKVASKHDLDTLRALALEAADRACAAVEEVLRSRNPLDRLKFERLGFDPLNHGSRQNIAEQIDLHATYMAALDGLQLLMDRFPGKEWELAAGVTGSGHDIRSSDGSVVAEVFAAVSPYNNAKLRLDREKLLRNKAATYRYVIFRSPSRPAGEVDGGKVVEVSLGVQ